ncbi:MAG: Hsp20 family protein [Rhodospirillales bacterium]|jgi:molecular chaperone IbpA|nr:heat-shock protein [Rhodospirillaceae bacterium]MDP6427128.1 Hsp20 family protein [Rhodospirillales bacterium]MDP6646643.1 Hsp20 family protein [Rhodospirillales bacterium]MDP6840946.1 Hsp20 family protein [Rhodospirillales bacterium]|tara:strand:+ start:129 stop:617 length:489 start_codon:yes stop_codon:yes gene_type:complete
MRTYDFSPLFRYSVGFDRIERMLDTASERAERAPGYPPYNIETVDQDSYRITMAVAGFGEDDLDIVIKENELSVSGKIDQDGGEAKYLHRGIANRSFERRFDIADHVKVTGANLDNGLLTIDLVRELPEALKPRQVEIKKGPAASIVGKARKMLGQDDKKAA